MALEVTETALMTDEDGCHANLSALCSLGIGVAMDDFGAGFSSLDRLRRLPITALKISGSLLQGVADDRLAADIFGMAANLGKAMKLLLVAEGVEGMAELALARAAGIHRAQGYALAAAVPADQLLAAIAVAETAARMRPVGAKHAVTKRAKAPAKAAAKLASPVEVKNAGKSTQKSGEKAGRLAAVPEVPSKRKATGKASVKAGDKAVKALNGNGSAKAGGKSGAPALEPTTVAVPEISRGRRKPARA